MYFASRILTGSFALTAANPPRDNSRQTKHVKKTERERVPFRRGNVQLLAPTGQQSGAPTKSYRKSCASRIKLNGKYEPQKTTNDARNLNCKNLPYSCFTICNRLNSNTRVSYLNTQLSRVQLLQARATAMQLNNLCSRCLLVGNHLARDIMSPIVASCAPA